MNEKVAKYLEEKREEEKREVLIAAGLYEKEYAPKSQELPNREYPYLDTKMIPNRPYKAIPIEVTDEEYEQVKKYAYSGNSKATQKSNARVLTVIGIIVYLIGFIGFSAMLDTDLFSAFITLEGAAISGTMFLGFAEIIKLLQSIKNKN